MATQQSLARVQELYIAYYGRPAEQAGLDYWADRADEEGIDTIINAFGTSAEFTELSDGKSNSELVNSIYQQAFGRDAEQAGLDFYTDLLDSGETTLAEIAATITSGAQNEDVAALNGRVIAANDYTETAGEDYDIDEGKDAINNAESVDPGAPGETFGLTVGADNLEGTADNDTFDASIGQNDSGQIVNTLSSADEIDGGAGNDTLNASLSAEVNLAGNPLNVQPTTTSVENINIEARSSVDDVVLDAKNMVGVNTFGSDYSDGDLVIQNVNTLDNEGNLRNTSDITVRMDHTDNFNSDGDASDLTVLFDDDYLIAGEETKTSLQLRIVNTYELAENDSPLVDFESVDFTVGGEDVSVDLAGVETYQDVADAINGVLNDMGIQGVEASTADPRTAVFTDDLDGYEQGELAGNYMPVNIVSTSGDLEPGTIKRTSDVADFDGLNTWVAGGSETTDDPISVNVELEKVGRAGQGGNLEIGGKSQAVVDGQANGIEVFNIDVLGTDAQPSSLGSIKSTNDTLQTINIETGAQFAGDDSVADLTIRGFNDVINEDGNRDSEDVYNPFGENVSTVNASGFEGDLTIGTEDGTIVNADDTPVDTTGSYAKDVTLNASGALGDVEFNADYNTVGNVVNTGEGNDLINLIGNGQAVIDTGAGNDTIYGDSVSVDVTAGAGNDAVYVDNSGGKGTAVVVATDELMQKVGAEDTNYGLLFGRTVTVTVNGNQGVNSAVAEAFANGFEGRAVVEANNVDGADRLTNQDDLNDAVVSAVENSETLSDLVEVKVVNGELQFTSKIDGDSIDVEIGVGASDWNDNDTETLESEYVAADNGYNDSANVDLSGGIGATSQTVQDLTVGTVSTATDQENTVHLGAGEDTIVLSSATGSVDTIVVDEAFGTSSIVNFTQGEDKLDLNTYLDSMKTDSGSEASQELIATTVETDTTLSANEVNVQELATGGSVSFNNLSADNLLNVFNSLEADTTYSGNNALVDGNGSAIVMVENEGNAGEYKMFNVSFDGTDDNFELSSSDIELIGTADFGAEVTFTPADIA